MEMVMGWGVEGSSAYPELQRYPSSIRMRQRAKKRCVELIERILTDDSGKKTSTPNSNMSKESFRDPDYTSRENEINSSSLRRTANVPPSDTTYNSCSILDITTPLW